VLYGRVKDDLGRTAVSWDSIFVGAEPKTVDSLEESIARIRKVRIPPLEKDGYDSFQYSTGFGLEMESQYLSWFATQNVENDPTATGGKAVWGTPQGYTGGTNFAPMEGDIYVRVKTKNNQGTQPIAWASWREDTGGIVGGRAILASDITAPNQWQWIRVPFTHVWGYSLIYFEFNTGGQNTLFDRFDVFSKPVPLARTREGGGMTIDFDDRNYRGIEIQIRYVNSKTGAWEDGPRINPYCATCSGSTSSVDSCAEGFQDCNGNPADGCETDLRVSALHCGKCGNSCGMSSKPGEVHQCAAGSCVQNSVLSRGHDGAYAIASDGSQLYWADWFGGNIESMPSGGGTVKKLATGQARPTSIAVDDTQIYWTTIEGGKVMRMPKNGGTPVEIAAGQAGPAVIALEGNNVYWGCYVGDGAIRTAPKTGGKVTTITTGVGGASALVVAGNHVYWTAGSQGQVARAPKTGGAVEVIAKGQAWPHGMVLDGSFAYWTNLKDGTINKAPLSPNASVTQLADGQQGPWTLALSGNTLYFTNYFGKEVMSLSTSGGKATPIAVDQPYPTGLTIHSGAVYWTTMTGGGATFFDYRNGTIVKAAAK
jgi:sugar lactone lactonase YvrE